MLHKTLIPLVLLGFLVSLISTSGRADERVGTGRESGVVQEIDKAVDPICGMSLKPKEIKHMAVHDGHLYAFCNKKCLETFTKDPEKYSGKMVKDPVCGMTFFDHQTDLVLEHEGRIAHFCSQKCVKEFSENPDKYEEKQE